MASTATTTAHLLIICISSTFQRLLGQTLLLGAFTLCAKRSLTEWKCSLQSSSYAPFWFGPSKTVDFDENVTEFSYIQSYNVAQLLCTHT